MPEDPLMKELARVAREADAPRDDAEAKELLRPFSDEEVRAMAAKAAEKLQGDAPEVEGSKGEASKGGSPSPAVARAQARWNRPLAIGAFVIAAAAALLLWVRTVPVEAPMASYDLVVEGGERPSRSDPQPPKD